MSQVVGHIDQLGWVAGKAILLFVVALVGFRIGERRTLAQLRPFDFVVSVALGAIIGRTATSNTTSFITGAGALITLLIAHRIIAQTRRRWRVMRMADDRPEVLVLQGALQGGGMARRPDRRRRLLDIAPTGGRRSCGGRCTDLRGRGGISLHRAGTPRGPMMVHALRAASLSE